MSSNILIVVLVFIVVQAGSPHFAPEAYWGYFLTDLSDHGRADEQGPDVTIPADAPKGLKFAIAEVLEQERGAWDGY